MGNKLNLKFRFRFSGSVPRFRRAFGAERPGVHGLTRGVRLPRLPFPVRSAIYMHTTAFFLAPFRSRTDTAKRRPNERPAQLSPGLRV